MSEEEAIKILKSPLLKSEGYERHQKAIDTVLKVLEKKDLEITALKMEHEHDIKMIDEVKGEAVKLYKIIDEMAEELANKYNDYEPCYLEDEMNCNEYEKCEDCIKCYFERKVEAEIK